jgi:hypothetical protein
MSEQDLTQRAFAAIRNEVDDVDEVREGPIVHGFLGGDLIVVYVKYKPGDHKDKNEDDLTDDFYVHFVGDVINVYEYPIDVYRTVAAYRPTFWHLVIASGTIPGLIAVLVTITICYLALAGQSEKIPQVLGAALTTILGFYFGSRVAHR